MFRLKQLKQKPLTVLKKYLIDVAYSWVFLAGYISTFRYGLCFFKNIRGDKMDRWNTILAAFFGALAISFEKKSRRTELALFCIPGFLESAWNLLKKRKYVVETKNGEVFIFTFAIAVIMYWIERQPDAIKSAYRSFFGSF